ncbi:MAG: HEPN domain-containing protein [Chloroflexi bacterium]|nr:HEPN domain-containing protein [Chloroflexota bacterium]
MPYEQLVQQGRIKPYKARPEEILKLLQVAARDLAAAERNLPDDHDWAYTIAYNAVLQAARALVLAHGYRPRGGEQHATVVQFVEETLGKKYSSQIVLFDQMRRKRHRVIYEMAGLVSKQEAEQGVKFAKKFVEEIRLLISKQASLKL